MSMTIPLGEWIEDEKGNRKLVKRKANCKVQQQFKQDCDINFIINRSVKSGIPLPRPEFNGQVAEFPDMDLHTAMIQVAKAKEVFESLPAKLRAKCNNDPVEFGRYLADEENKAELVKYGLLTPKEKPKEVIQKVEVVNKDPDPDPDPKK